MIEPARLWILGQREAFRSPALKFKVKDIMRLNLGSGKKRILGYTNVDIDPGCEPDILCDILFLPMEEGTVEEIMAIHVFEHLWLIDIPIALREWKRVLVPGGKLVLEMPCLDKIVRNLLITDNDQMTLWGLYGDPMRSRDKNAYELHKWCWNEKTLVNVLDKAGFRNIVFDEPIFHFKERDFRATAVK